jgi:hypothetical protein
VAGFQSEVMEKERAAAWRKSESDLEEYDYLLLGQRLFLRVEKEAHFKALAIDQQGLTKFPDSIRLKRKWCGAT